MEQSENRPSSSLHSTHNMQYAKQCAVCAIVTDSSYVRQSMQGLYLNRSFDIDVCNNLSPENITCKLVTESEAYTKEN